MIERRSLWARSVDGVFAGGLAFGVNTLIVVVQVPALLHLWGDATYGAWTSLMAAASFVTILDIGHQNLVGNKLCALWAGPRSELKAELGSGLRVATVLGLIQLAVGIAICFAVALSGVAAGEIRQVLVSVIAYLMYWAAFGSVGGVLVRLYPPAGMYAWGQLLGSVSRIAALVGILTGAYLGGGIAGAMWGQICFGITFNLFLLFDLRRRFGDLFWPWSSGVWSRGWRNFKDSIALSLGSLAEQAGGNGLVLILGGVLGPAQLTKFATMRTLANTGVQASTILLSPVLPDLIRSRVECRGSRVSAILSSAFFLGSFFYASGLVFSMLFVERIYLEWTRDKINFDAPFFILMALAVGVRIWASPLMVYIAGQNMVRDQSLIVFSRVGVALALTLLLLPSAGLLSVAIALLCGELVGATISARRAHLDLLEVDGEGFWRMAFLGVLQLLVAAVSWTGLIWMPGGKLVWCSVGLGLICCLGVLQWRVLPVGLRLQVMRAVGL